MLKASIIIPSYNSKERLYLNLVALNNQTYKSDDIEIIAVDNGSTDGTSEMLDDFRLKYDLKRVRVESNKGIANGRNEGIKRAKGDLLIFHDSDMIASKNFIEKHLKAHDNVNDLVVCGNPWKRIYTFYYKGFSNDQLKSLKEKMKIDDPASLDNACQLVTEDMINDFELDDYVFDLEIDFIKELKSIVARYGTDFEKYSLPWRFCITNNLSVARNKVMKIGMFDSNIFKYGYEDYDLGFRLYKSGCRFKLAQDIISIHQEHPANFTYLDLMENLNYICNKYNDINHLDIILVCVGDTLSSKKDDLYNLIKDINKALALRKYNLILEVFLKLLQLYRKKIFDPNEDDSVLVFAYVAENMPSIVHDVPELIYTHELHSFTDQLCSLLMNLLGIDLEPILRR